MPKEILFFITISFIYSLKITLCHAHTKIYFCKHMQLQPSHLALWSHTVRSTQFYTPSEEKDVLVCIITATQRSCNYTGTWLDRTSQGLRNIALRLGLSCPRPRLQTANQARGPVGPRDFSCGRLKNNHVSGGKV